MDVDSYIGKYGPEWSRLETVCAKGGPGLARLQGPEIRDAIRLYLRASAHLAEVRSRYRDASLEEYLNGVVTRAHAAIYSARPRTVRGFFRFFGVRYRRAIKETAPYILVAAGILLLVTLSSYLWISTSATARAGVLPPDALAQIRRAGGHRRAGLGPPPEISTFILFNNVTVAFLAFALGVTVGIGTIWVLVRNALLLGILGGAYSAVGKGGPFWALILPHGMLELTAICISAGAGLRMGWAIVSPGDKRRTEAFREAAASAVIVVIGVIPAFVIAAFIEGFITGTSVPGPVQLGIGTVAEVAYVLWLFGLPERFRGAPST